MALLPQFDTPASLRDAPAGSPFYAAWSNFIAAGLAAVTPGDNGGAFYDPTQTDVNVAATKTLTWMGFPRDVLLPGNRDNKLAAYVAADADVAFRDPQNEYFEWYVKRNNAGKITKLTFVTETPEYYQRLWNTDPGLVRRPVSNPRQPRCSPSGSSDRHRRVQPVQPLEHNGRHRPLHPEHQHAIGRAWPGPELRHGPTAVSRQFRGTTWLSHRAHGGRSQSGVRRAHADSARPPRELQGSCRPVHR